MSEKPPEGVVALVDELVRRAVAARASDLHFEPADDGLRVRLRVDGLLQDDQTLPAGVAPNVIARLKVLSGLLTYRTDIPQEGGIERGHGQYACDIRVATFPTVRGERAVLRLMGNARRLLDLDELGHSAELTARFAECLEQSQGLLVVCGPAGSGKTTTLYAALNHLRARLPGASILAVEDPVEVRMDGITQIQVTPHRNLTYAVALRSLLRQDPQVLMIGEVRDAETAQVVVEAALTGHLLLTTMHSGSPAAAIIRLLELGIPAYQLTSTLHAVLAQRLLRTCCTHCAGAAGKTDCTFCLGTGYAGRSAIGQLVTLHDALRQAIMGGADAAELREPCRGTGTLADDAQRLIAAGHTTQAEAERVLGGPTG